MWTRPARRDRRSLQRARLKLIRAALVAVLAVSVSLTVAAVWRTFATNRLNAQLQSLHTADGAAPSAEIAAPPMQDFAQAADSDRSWQSAYASELPEGIRLMGGGSAVAAVAAAEQPARTVGNAATTTAYHITDAQLLPEMLKLSKANPDLVGWLYNDGVVNLPVVYRDNEYYLTHDFYGHHSKAGTLFLDVNHPLTEDAANLLIHGHDMTDGTMFGLLIHYQRGGYIDKHPVIKLSTLWDVERYAVFAVLRTPVDPRKDGFVNYYAHPTFASDADFCAYIDTLRRHALQTADVDVQPGDGLLTLTTCLGDDRLVVVARRLREDEPASTDRQEGQT